MDIKLKPHVKEIWNLVPEAKLAGGALRSFFDDTPIKDYDFYLMPDQSYLLEPLYSKVMNAGGKSTRCSQHFFEFVYKDSIFQVISFVPHSSVFELLEQFDFTVCQIAMTYSGNVYSARHFHTDAIRKILTLSKEIVTPKTIERTIRYANKGYKIDHSFYYDLYRKIKSSPEEVVPWDLYDN